LKNLTIKRGSAVESEPNEEDTRYPATYIAGCYNKVISNIEGRPVQTEDLVNFPNWTRITFK
jgi:trehalose/maltose hydrolase-like predicted phosphorylase